VRAPSALGKGVALSIVPSSLAGPLRVLDRYAIFDEIAAGGMATVHVGRLMGPVGFNRTVAIKRLHPQYAKDAEFVSMFLDEARLASRIRHPNVIQTIDVVAKEGELFLVMEYVPGESMSRLLSVVRGSGGRIPLGVSSGIAFGLLNGLHAAHEAKNEQGAPLNLVHRDVSPQNVLVGTDGVARALDFGIAKAVTQVHSTREGQLKGKLAYMAPEQLDGIASRATDVYAAAVVTWEALTAKRLFHGDSERTILGKLLAGAKEPPSRHNPEVPKELDAVIMRGLSVDPDKRFATALEMARAIAKIVPIAAPLDIGEWVEQTASVAIQSRAALVARVEAESSTGSDVANRLAAAVVAGTDPRLILDSTPPPAEPPEDNPTDLLDELAESDPPHAQKQPQLTSGSIPTQLGASMPQRMDPPVSPVRRPAMLAAAALGGALLVLGILRLTQAPAAVPSATAAAPLAPQSAEPSVVTAPTVEIPQAVVAASAAPPPPAASVDTASPSASSPVSPSRVGIAPKAPAPHAAPRAGAPRSPNQPRIDDPLLQAR
jgi:eukaryotic-like serine/threonine-protein kinase